MLNMHNNKTQKTISTIIIILLVLCMVVPVIASAFQLNTIFIISRTNNKLKTTDYIKRKKNVNKLRSAVAVLIAFVSLSVMLMGCGSGNDNEKREVVYGTTMSSSGIIPNGIFLDGVDVSGLNREQAIEKVYAYLDELGQQTITLYSGDYRQEVKISDLGLLWVNETVVDEAIEVTGGNNAVRRYMAIKDVEKDGASFELYVTFDASTLWEYIGTFQVADLDVGSTVIDLQYNFYVRYKAGEREFEMTLYNFEEPETTEELQI